MRIPRLCSVKHPSAPAWGAPQLDPDEVASFHHQLVLLLGRNPEEGTVEALGSGFMIGATEDSVFVVTAAHVLFGRYFEDVRERSRSGAAFDGLLSERETRAEEAKDLSNILAKELITALVISDAGPSYQFVVADGSTGLDPRAIDMAFLQLACLGSGDRPIDLIGMPMDFEPVTPGEIVAVAGFAEGEVAWKAPIDKLDQAVNEWRKSLVVRVGRVAEITTRGEGARGGFPLMRSTIPALGNMSGGPLFRVKNPRGSPLLHGIANQQMNAAIGVISRGNPGGALLAYSHSADGETWMTPMTAIRELGLLPCRGKRLSLEEMIKSEILVDYSTIAQHANNMPPEPDDPGVIRVRLSRTGDRIVERLRKHRQ